MFILMIVMATIACGFSSRLMIEQAETEIFPDATNIECDFIADYVAIGDYMRSIKGEYFDDYKNRGIIEGLAIDTVANFKDKTVKNDVIELKLEVFGDKFSEVSIESGQKIMYANNVFCDLLGCGYGDYISFCGSEFMIAGVENSPAQEKNKIITIPYSAELADWDISNTEGQSIIKIYLLSFNGLTKNFNKSIYEDLNKIGVRKGKEYVNSVLVQSLIMLLAFLVAASLSVISVTNYHQSVNARKYNIYKMIGASPKVVTGIMLFETGVIAAIAVGIGLLVDFIISLFVNIGSLSRLLWLHYLILFIVTLLAVMVMVTIKTVKMAKRLPMQQPIKPKKRRKKV